MLKYSSIIYVLLSVCSLHAQSNLQDIDKELQVLQQQLHDYQLKKVDDQVEGQGLMIADWPAYGRDIQKIKEDDDHIRELRQQIRVLEKKKETLQQE